jgi:uncharacterized protein involved in response to NO
MTNFGLGHIVGEQRRGGIPRGIKRTGLPLLSYGFRPFFLGASSFAVVAMVTWTGALALGWEVAGDYGVINWHAHEMLFGYGAAALAGFMLTAIPNWTGRLPVSGAPLLALVLLWIAGRVAMAMPVLGLPASVVIDAAFLPLLAVIAGREVVAGKNWKNLKVLAGISTLALTNVAFHLSALLNGEAIVPSRLATGIFVMLVAVIAGRIVPSFTRNWLVRRGGAIVPAPFDRIDKAAIVSLAVALLVWVTQPEGIMTAIVAAPALGLNAYRLVRWQGHRTLDEPLLLMLHLAYAFVPLGLVAISLAALGWIAAPSALHVLTVGCIGLMTFAVMARACLGHTGRPLTASWQATAGFFALVLAAVVRPFAEIVPEAYHVLLALSGGCWIAAFGLFLAAYARILVTPSLR